MSSIPFSHRSRRNTGKSQQLLVSGLERHAIDNLLKSNQLEPHTQGIYGRPGSNLTWQGLVFSLQKMFDDFTVGGLTAIELHGLAHYLPLSEKKNNSSIPSAIYTALGKQAFAQS